MGHRVGWPKETRQKWNSRNPFMPWDSLTWQSYPARNCRALFRTRKDVCFSHWVCCFPEVAGMFSANPHQHWQCTFPSKCYCAALIYGSLQRSPIVANLSGSSQEMFLNAYPGFPTLWAIVVKKNSKNHTGMQTGEDLRFGLDRGSGKAVGCLSRLLPPRWPSSLWGQWALPHLTTWPPRGLARSQGSRSISWAQSCCQHSNQWAFPWHQLHSPSQQVVFPAGMNTKLIINKIK